MAFAICSSLAPLHEARAGPDGVLQWLAPGSRASPWTGADAFVSPLADAAGWWGDFVPASARRVAVESHSSIPLTGRATGGHGVLVTRETAATFGWDGDFGRRRWIAAASVATPHWESSWRSGKNALGLQGSGTRARVGLRLQNLLPGFDVQLVAPLWRSGSMRGEAPGAGLRWCLGEWLAVQVHVARSRTPEPMRSSLAGMEWAASLNVAALERAAAASARLPGGIALRVELRRADSRPEAERTSALVYSIAPQGRSRSARGAVLWGRESGRRVLVGFTTADLDARGTASWGGVSFGQLQYARGTLHSQLGSLQWPLSPRLRARFECEAFEIRAEARASFETWPFTPTVVDLLGPRRIGKAQFAVPVERLQIGIEGDAGAASRFGASLAWYDARPRADVAHWRPAFLVFGRADLHADQLAIERMQALGVHLGGRLQRGTVQVGVEFEQLVPLRTRRRAAPAAATAPGAGDTGQPASGRDTGHGSWPSGTSFALSLSHRL